MNLMLIPSEVESGILLGKEARPDARGGPWKLYRTLSSVWAVCGIGPAAAALSAAHLIHVVQPHRVFLLGIAGAFPQSGLKVGGVIQARSETFADLGYRDGNNFRNLDAMRLNLLPARTQDIGCRFALPLLDEHEPGTDFITVSAICADTSRAGALWSSFRPGVENMEGAAVALTCKMLERPFYEIRAISNLVGPRDPASWRVEAPLALLYRWLKSRVEL